MHVYDAEWTRESDGAIRLSVRRIVRPKIALEKSRHVA